MINVSSFWAKPVTEVLRELNSSPNGLTSSEARQRLKLYGLNTLKATTTRNGFILFVSQFKSPITLILIFAATLSLFLGDLTNTLIIFFIIFVSAVLSFWQEIGARGAVDKLLSIIKIKAAVLRDGKCEEIAIEEIIPGDIVELSAGDIIPGDCLIIHSKDLFINEASLTGETFPVEKNGGIAEADAALSKRLNSLFMGTHVVSGTATALVVQTGARTEFGNVAKHVAATPPETEFERGIKKFGYLLMEVTLILVITIFAINIYFHKPAIDSLLFSLALAVGLTPQLLPAIISINLSHGAKNMAKAQVIVKRLSSIENFGSMDVLCSDKTGTLTEGSVKVKDFIDSSGGRNEKVFLYTYLNSNFETGFKNPIDTAILNHAACDISNYKKTDEIPYDFIRKRLSIVVNSNSGHLLITKGAFQNVLDVCSLVETGNNQFNNIEEARDQLAQQFESLSKDGLRVIAVAYRNINDEGTINKSFERDLIFLGFVTLFDPPKEGILDTIKSLNETGINFKIITGDNQHIATKLGRKVFSHSPKVLTGKEMYSISVEAFVRLVNSVDVFAEVEPNQKERILIALKRNGNVVGYIGDGINDASALHVADVGISVDTAVDVAKESADIVLLDKDLNVLMAGVKEGRKTFSNTLKYILMATSANFGNMFSMAGASLFLPYLPLLPSQILLTNLLTDLPEMTIATDNVEENTVAKPRKWNLAFIKKFMIAFGLMSSIFDFATFGILLVALQAGQDEFRTGWFVESVVSASMIVLVVRSPYSIFKSRPGKYLTIAVLCVSIFTLALPFTPLARILGFTTLPLNYLLALLGIVLLYITSTEILKRFFFRH